MPRPRYTTKREITIVHQHLPNTHLSKSITKFTRCTVCNVALLVESWTDERIILRFLETGTTCGIDGCDSEDK
jgi:hypothetical protein